MPLFVFCDHGGNEGRGVWGDLGLDASLWNSHFALDIGAAQVAEALAARFSTDPLIHMTSRLFADPNRDPADRACIPIDLAGTEVAGNLSLTADERIARIRLVHEPYHQSLARALRTEDGKWRSKAALSVHSFTPEFGGVRREVGISFLTKHDEGTARLLTSHLKRAFPDIVIRNNDPYSGWLYNYTIDRHLGSFSLPHALIEIRNDLAVDAAFRQRLITALTRAFAELIENA